MDATQDTLKSDVLLLDKLFKAKMKNKTKENRIMNGKRPVNSFYFQSSEVEYIKCFVLFFPSDEPS